MVNKITSDLYPGYDGECAIAASAADMDRDTFFKVYYQSPQGKHSIVSFDEEFLARNKNTVSAFLRRHTGCVVGAFRNGTTHLHDLIFALRKVKNHFIIKLDEASPKFSEMISSDYPIIWPGKQAKGRNKRGSHLSLFCPKEVKSKGVIMKTILTEGSNVKCPHFLKGQTLSLGHVYGDKRRIINGKVVHGQEYVRFFEYASQKFQFEPRFQLGRIIYFQQNQTWGGLHKNVSSIVI